MIIKYTECACKRAEHVIRLMYYPGDDSLYVVYFLQTGGLFKRIATAVKYILGYKCRYGHFGETMLMEEEATAMVGILNEFLGQLHEKSN